MCGSFLVNFKSYIVLLVLIFLLCGNLVAAKPSPNASPNDGMVCAVEMPANATEVEHDYLILCDKGFKHICTSMPFKYYCTAQRSVAYRVFDQSCRNNCYCARLGSETFANTIVTGPSSSFMGISCKDKRDKSFERNATHTSGSSSNSSFMPAKLICLLLILCFIAHGSAEPLPIASPKASPEQDVASSAANTTSESDTEAKWLLVCTKYQRECLSPPYSLTCDSNGVVTYPLLYKNWNCLQYCNCHIAGVCVFGQGVPGTPMSNPCKAKRDLTLEGRNTTQTSGASSTRLSVGRVLMICLVMLFFLAQATLADAIPTFDQSSTALTAKDIDVTAAAANVTTEGNTEGSNYYVTCVKYQKECTHKPYNLACNNHGIITYNKHAKSLDCLQYCSCMRFGTGLGSCFPPGVPGILASVPCKERRELSLRNATAISGANRGVSFLLS